MMHYYSFGQASFSAIPSSTLIGINDRLQIDFQAENAEVENITPPKFPNFIVESGPISQSGMTMVNGNTSKYYSISFVLRPLKKGKFIIGSATAKLDGRIYQSKPLSIEVTEGSHGRKANPYNPYNPYGNLRVEDPRTQPSRLYNDYILKPGENIQEKVAKNMFVKVDVSKTSCYVGEPIVATYKLYTRLKSESNLSKSPSFNGFSVLDLELRNGYGMQAESFDGKDYNVYLLRKVQLYALQPGDIELDEAEVENSVSFVKSSYAGAYDPSMLQDILNAFAASQLPPEAVQSLKVTLKSKAQTIHVMALPEEGKPEKFKGAVGQFTMNAWIVKPAMSTDDAGNLRIDLNGSGNLHLISGPSLQWPDSVEAFEPKIKESLDKSTVPVSGIKQYAYPFTIAAPGKYQIPAISFPYFDPSSKSYKTLRSEVMEITVSKGKGVQTQPGMQANNGAEMKEGWQIAAYAGSAIFLLMAVLFFYKKRKKPLDAANDMEEPEHTVEIAEPEEEVIIPVSPLILPQEKLCEGDAEGFFHSLNLSLKHYLSVKLAIPSDQLNKKNIEESMDRQGHSIHTANLVSSLLDDIEMNLYAAPLFINSGNE